MPSALQPDQTPNRTRMSPRRVNLRLQTSKSQSASRKHRMPCWEKKALCHKPSVSDGNLTCVERFRNKRHQKTRRTPRFAKRCCASLSWPRSEFSICTNLKILSTCGQGHLTCTLGHWTLGKGRGNMPFMSS